MTGPQVTGDTLPPQQLNAAGILEALAHVYHNSPGTRVACTDGGAPQPVGYQTCATAVAKQTPLPTELLYSVREKDQIRTLRLTLWSVRRD